MVEIMSIIAFTDVENKIIEIRQQNVIVDSDVAVLYGVETKHINQAVRNNPERFIAGFVVELTEIEKLELVKNFDRFKNLKHSSSLPKAFTEQGLYMLATILKSNQAVQTTIAIVQTFAKVREVSRIVNTLPTVKQDSVEQNKLMQKAGDIISELVVPDNIESEETEASIELNFAVVKFKYSVKKKSK
jgi:hypothetical protein